MKYKIQYKSPVGDLILTSDGEFLIGLWFLNSPNFNKEEVQDFVEKREIFEESIKWLDIYFCGKVPSFTPKFLLENITNFRKDVVDELLKIPYGKTVSYGDIAKRIEKKRGIKKMSSQAVGGAVGWNPISIIIPCHRVVGSNKKLIGYNGGIENKIALLEYESANIKGEKDE